MPIAASLSDGSTSTKQQVTSGKGTAPKVQVTGSTNPRTSHTSAPAPASVPVSPSTADAYDFYGGGGGYDAGYGGGGGTAAPVMSETDFLNSDDVYLAALSRYNKQYQDLLADITRRQGDYEGTYKNSLEDLGYIEGVNGGPNSWAWGNEQTAAGRGYQSLIQDFAARGLLHSGDYLRSQDNLASSLGNQFTGMQTAKTQFDEGLNAERTAGQTAQESGVGQARAEALARMAQLYGAV